MRQEQDDDGEERRHQLKLSNLAQGRKIFHQGKK